MTGRGVEEKGSRVGGCLQADKKKHDHDKKKIASHEFRQSSSYLMLLLFCNFFSENHIIDTVSCVGVKLIDMPAIRHSVLFRGIESSCCKWSYFVPVSLSLGV